MIHQVVKGFWVLGLVSLMSGTAMAASSVSQDLIVRFREPLNNQLQATEAALSADGVEQAQLLNGEEGLVRLHFGSAEEASLAATKLELSGDVESVAMNHLYRPALHLRARAADLAPPQGMFDSFLSVPFADLLRGGAPEVLLPPSSLTPGVDPLAKKDWALKNIKMPAISRLDALMAASSPIVAAVIDTGVDYNHEDLIGAMWRNPDNNKEVGFDFAHDNNRPYDLVKFDIEGCLKDIGCSMGANQGKFIPNPGHGTHCAGHVGAVANNSTGIRGVGGKTKLMGLKFFYDAGEANAGQGDDAAAIKSIDYAVKHGAKVISASWGGRIPRDESEKSELKNALIRAQKAGVLVVIAAGNDGVDQDTVEDPSYPAAYDLDNLIVVAATDVHDKLGSFSSYGRRSVHIAAPGVKILSTTGDGSYSDIVAKYKDKQGKEHQMDWNGTSMATPIVAGAVALVWSKFPKADYHEIRSRILDSARQVPGLADKVSTGGILNVSAALGLTATR